MSNHLQMSLQRQHILLSYFKTLSVGPVFLIGLNPRPPAQKSGALPTELTDRRSTGNEKGRSQVMKMSFNYHQLQRWEEFFLNKLRWEEF